KNGGSSQNRVRTLYGQRKYVAVKAFYSSNNYQITGSHRQGGAEQYGFCDQPLFHLRHLHKNT
ncbi:MAG: hypothetical protein RSA52_10305, partial [Acetivibrio sp.]